MSTADAFSVWMHVCLYALAHVQRVVYVYVCAGGQDSTAGVIPPVLFGFCLEAESLTKREACPFG